MRSTRVRYRRNAIEHVIVVFEYHGTTSHLELSTGYFRNEKNFLHFTEYLKIVDTIYKREKSKDRECIGRRQYSSDETISNTIDARRSKRKEKRNEIPISRELFTYHLCGFHRVAKSSQRAFWKWACKAISKISVTVYWTTLTDGCCSSSDNARSTTSEYEY